MYMQSTSTTLLSKDRALVEHSKVPMVTVAATFRHQLVKTHKLKDAQIPIDEVLFSRAHYSMALGVAVKAWGKKIDAKKAWLVDPTNYVQEKDWGKIEFTEEVAKLMARNSLLKAIKDLIDTKVRSKLPITAAITTPLLYLFEDIHTPILSFHYEAGNILASVGKQVIQVVTDPHVRDQYLDYAQLPTVRFCVFDENTKVSLIEKAATFGKVVDPHRVVVTGPPVDPRVVAARAKKNPANLKKRPLRLVVSTGGLGTNRDEMLTCIRSLAPLLREATPCIQLIVYVGVHQDIRDAVHDLCTQEGVQTAAITAVDAPVRVLYSPHVVDANEALIKYAFPWADGFVTKPSGDMAYDAAAAGCFLLTLEPWGEWEDNIRDVFEQRSISRRAIPEHFAEQVKSLIAEEDGKSWMQQAMKNALNLPDLFTDGAKNILAQMPK